MPDWFAQNGIATVQQPQSTAGVDWFAQNGIQTVAGAKPQPQPTASGRFSEEFWKRANPIEWVKGLVEAAKHPVDTAVGIISADPKFLTEAKEAADKGDYYKATRKVLSYMSMGLGHELDTQADLLEKGDVAGGFGAMAGMATQFVAPEVAARGVAAMPAVKIGKPANPAVAEAAKFGRDRGVPMDAATATDNMAVRAAQHISDRSLGGASVAGKAFQEQAEGLATLGEQLAAKGYPKAVTAEQAGQGVRDALEGRIRQFDQAADAEYGRLRGIAEQHRETVQTTGPKAAPEDAAFTFTSKTNALPDEVFEAAYADARRNGFQGSRAQLRSRFDEQLQSGFDALKEQASIQAEYGPEALLASIRKYGGIRPFEREIGSGAKLRGDFESLVESFRASSGFSQRGKSSIFRKDGLGLDGMVDRLRQDPRWKPMINDTNDLLDALNEAARSGPTAAMRTTVEDALHVTDVRPGAKWWIPRTEEVQAMPVDLRGVRSQLQSTYDELNRQRSLTPFAPESGKARAFDALDRLLYGSPAADGARLPKDFAALTDVDKALGDIKALARGKGTNLDALRTEGQGVAAHIVRVLDEEVRKTAAGYGPEAITALEKGRGATRAKYAVGEIYKTIREEPVQAFARATAGKDSAIAELRQVAKYAPEELPKIGRAYLDGLLETATAEGGFARADKLFADWHKMGPETKRLLFKDPAHLRDLDNFFLLAKTMAKNANPSGTAHAAAMMTHGAQIITAPWSFVGTVIGTNRLSTFLHSPQGVKLLTEGLRQPPSAAARQAWMQKVRKFGATQGVVLGSQHPAGAVPR